MARPSRRPGDGERVSTRVGTARRIMVDARLGMGSGIGRYVQNIVPRVAARLPGVAFDLVVDPQEAGRVAGFMQDRARNVVICPDATPPFSLREQTAFPARAKAADATWFVNYWMPLRWRGPSLVVVHDLLHLVPELFPTPLPKRLLSRATFEKVRRDANEIIFISRFTEREFLSRVGARRGRGTIIHHGVDHYGTAPAPAAPPAKQRRMIVVAAAKRHKNFTVILEAWQRAALSDGWRLTVITPGDALRSSIALDPAALERQGVDLRHGVSDAELSALYDQSAILLMPSHYEGFGLPLLEGMKHACLPICSTAEALVEVGAGGEVAYVSGHDVEGWRWAMERLARRVEDDPAWLAAAGQRNSHHAEQWTWDQTADQTAAVLDRLLTAGEASTAHDRPFATVEEKQDVVVS